MPRHVVELDAARHVYEELRMLSPTERDRVMTWVLSRLAADGSSAPVPGIKVGKP